MTLLDTGDVYGLGHNDVRHIGLSEVGAETIRRAQAVHPIGARRVPSSATCSTPRDPARQEK